MKIIIYPLMCLCARIGYPLIPVLYKLRLNRSWSILLKLLPKDGSFVKSVYGPYLKEKQGDHQFYLCATGKSGFN